MEQKNQIAAVYADGGPVMYQELRLAFNVDSSGTGCNPVRLPVMLIPPASAGDEAATKCQGPDWIPIEPIILSARPQFQGT